MGFQKFVNRVREIRRKEEGTNMVRHIAMCVCLNFDSLDKGLSCKVKGQGGK